jgi:hypothetical protein
MAASGRRVAERDGAEPHARMTSLLEFVHSPRFLQLVMLGVVVEAAALLLFHRRTGRGPRPMLVCSFLGAGLAFLVALYAVRALVSPSIVFIVALTSALVFHVWHLALLARR